ncbi:hypothetical protein DDE82_009052 [Stemphylium lycopersici]|uniref:Uncharacterized protein n=1 Tax=Stemphylium lycopersici TaxID=183478 RepID=A0A364MRD7_STELY|nr:hypothetical protein TW65_07334 [Stemphylium lycopersici]RAQ98642.1 hypothetical protein DDE82_009052 [Stemphylium lycopersici]RAR00576.1 hypothetical protein DDE83_009089 [Stemphylium lycopersici]
MTTASLNEEKEGSSRTYLIPVWNYPSTGQSPKVVFLIGFIRQSEHLDTAADIVAQALVTPYNPPNGRSGRLVWIAVVDPFNSQWIVFKCSEHVTGTGPEMNEYGRYPTTPTASIVATMQTALSQNIVTYG